MPQPYERFDAWRLSHQLALEVYRVTSDWPKGEMFGLTAQARRAATSAAVNIVEGSAKRGAAEFRRYLDISNGSLAELGYLLRLGKDLGYLKVSAWEDIESRRDRAAQALFGLYRALGKR